MSAICTSVLLNLACTAESWCILKCPKVLLQPVSYSLTRGVQVKRHQLSSSTPKHHLLCHCSAGLLVSTRSLCCTVKLACGGGHGHGILVFIACVLACAFQLWQPQEDLNCCQRAAPAFTPQLGTDYTFNIAQNLPAHDQEMTSPFLNNTACPNQRATALSTQQGVRKLRTPTSSTPVYAGSERCHARLHIWL